MASFIYKRELTNYITKLSCMFTFEEFQAEILPESCIETHLQQNVA